MINSLFLVGEIKKINVSTPKDPSKPESAVMLVQYGPNRETSNNTVEFVNAVMVRVPSFKFPKLKAQLKVGKKIQIHAHVQGVLKEGIAEGFFTTELVADRVMVLDGSEDTADAAES